LEGRYIATVVEKNTYGCATELVLDTPANFQAQPGQFVHICCGTDSGSILRRPFSLFDLSETRMSLLIKTMGKGSAWLAARELGDGVDFLGPLGKGYTVPSTGSYILLAGGAGIASLHYLAKRMVSIGLDASILWGIERSEEYGELPIQLGRDTDLQMASMDGSIGFKGSAVGLFDASLNRKYGRIYACGPKGMLTSLAEIIGRLESHTFEVSMEERMACVGACRGCAVPAASPGGSYLMVCKDGPVFNGGELDWKMIRKLIWK
jgi:dihydroorotate dehydrogenase electron transfer subunit